MTKDEVIAYHEREGHYELAQQKEKERLKSVIPVTERIVGKTSDGRSQFLWTGQIKKEYVPTPKSLKKYKRKSFIKVNNRKINANTNTRLLL